jgi:metallo-beta-lactamase class B
MLIKKILLAVAVLITVAAKAQVTKPPPVMDPNWVKDYEPFRIAGNLYYVGTYDLACYLITTKQGHILINTGMAESAPVIKRHVEKLGFKSKDIKILLATHAHFDHVAAMAKVKKLTGAKMMIHVADSTVLADGGNSDYIFGGRGSMFEPVRAEETLKNNSIITLGETRLVVLHHPGHTKGACSFLLDTKDEKRNYRVLIANMPKMLPEVKPAGMPGYADVGKDFAYTYEAMKKLNFDIWVASHASQFELHKKHKPGDSYNPRVFIDRKGYEALLEKLKLEYLEKLKAK